jgi:hypothetical protein
MALREACDAVAMAAGTIASGIENLDEDLAYQGVRDLQDASHLLRGADAQVRALTGG